MTLLTPTAQLPTPTGLITSLCSSLSPDDENNDNLDESLDEARLSTLDRLTWPRLRLDQINLILRYSPPCRALQGSRRENKTVETKSRLSCSGNIPYSIPLSPYTLSGTTRVHVRTGVRCMRSGTAHGNSHLGSTGLSFLVTATVEFPE